MRQGTTHACHILTTNGQFVPRPLVADKGRGTRSHRPTHPGRPHFVKTFFVKTLPVLPISPPNPQLEIGNIGTDNTPTLATLPSPPSRAAASASLGVFAFLWVANPRKGRIRKPSCLHESHDITSRVTESMLLYQRGPCGPPHWQHCPHRLMGRVVLGEPPPDHDESHGIASRATESMLLWQRGLAQSHDRHGLM